MSAGNRNLGQRARYWEKRKELQTKLANARTALLDGKIPLAKQLFLASDEIEREARHMAAELKLAVPPAQVAPMLSQSIQEKYEALVQGDLIDAATIRLQFQGIAEIERAVSGSTTAEADAMPASVLFEKSKQALKSEQFDRAEEYLNHIREQDRNNLDVEMQLATVELARARYAHAHGDSEGAQRFINNASSIHERVRAAPGYSPQGDDFNDRIAEEHAAALFAAGSKAQRQIRLLLARDYFRRVASTSSYGPQARDRIRALTLWINASFGAAAVAALLLIGACVYLLNSRLTVPPIVATSITVSSTIVPTAASTSSIATAPTSVPTAKPTMSPTTSAPTTALETRSTEASQTTTAFDQQTAQAIAALDQQTAAAQASQTAAALSGQTATAEIPTATSAAESPTATAPTQPPAPTNTRVPPPAPTRIPSLFMAVQRTNSGKDLKCINVHVVFPGGYSGDGWTLVAEGLGITVPFNTGGYAALCVRRERQEFRFSILPPAGLRVTGNRSVPAQGSDNFEAYTRVVR